MLVTFIIGLPGSGKTTLAQKICSETGATLIDDPRDMKVDYEGFASSFKTREGENILIKGDKDYVICDPWLTEEQSRELAKKAFSKFQIKEIFFENDVEKCKKNVALRKTRSDVNFDCFRYDLPKNIRTLEIWQPL